MKILLLSFINEELHHIFNKIENEISNLLKYSPESKAFNIGETKRLSSTYKKINFIYSEKENLNIFKTINKKVLIAEDIIKSENPDVVYCRYQPATYSNSSFIELSSKYKNFVFELQSILESEMRSQFLFEELYQEENFFPMLLDSALGFVAITEEIAKHQKSRITNKNIPYHILGNGISTSSYQIKKRPPMNAINLIMIAHFHPWHSPERILNPIQNNKGNDINITLIGKGNYFEKLKTKYGNNKFIVFKEWLDKEKLNCEFDNAHIAVSSLGLHKIGLKEAATLKTREYFTRGIPTIISYKDTDIDHDYQNILKVPADDSELDLDEIRKFYTKVYVNNNLESDINAYAKANMDWENKIFRLFNFLKNIKENIKPIIVKKPEDKKSFELVISRYNEKIEWVNDFIENSTIYNKGKDDIDYPYIRLENIGREGETYLNHIISNYDNLSEYTVFTQADPFTHSPDFIELLFSKENFQKIQPLTWKWLDFGEHKPECWWLESLNKDGIPPLSIRSADKTHWIRTLKVHVERLDHNFNCIYPFKYIDGGVFFHLIPDIKKFYNIKETPLDFYWNLFGFEEDIPLSIPFSFAAIFGVHRDIIRERPVSFYKKARKILLHCESNGYILERLWLSIFKFDKYYKHNFNG